jgi:hypothetical protein
MYKSSTAFLPQPYSLMHVRIMQPPRNEFIKLIGFESYKSWIRLMFGGSNLSVFQLLTMFTFPYISTILQLTIFPPFEKQVSLPSSPRCRFLANCLRVEEAHKFPFHDTVAFHEGGPATNPAGVESELLDRPIFLFSVSPPTDATQLGRLAP